MVQENHHKIHALIFVFYLLILSGCGVQNSEQTALVTASTEVPPSTPAPLSKRTAITPTPAEEPEPQRVLFRGVPGCETEFNITANHPIQLYYGVWGSIGEEMAQISSDKMDVTLAMDGIEVEGIKQPVAPDLVEHCGPDSEEVYWMFYIAKLADIPPGVHHFDVTYHASELIDDGTGRTVGPGTLFTHSFTINATFEAEGEGFDQAVLSLPAVHRLPNNPIIVPEMLPGEEGENINGPSLIRVPDWVEGALGNYYLYFAHHIGSTIRMAYADDLAGPWQLYEGGTLQLEDTICDQIEGSIYLDYKHVASPDVHVDHQAEQIRMYFHCPIYLSGPVENDDSYAQVSLLATSSDGLSFEAQAEPLGNAYFRVFYWDNYYYALSMPGVFYRSSDGISGFEQGPTLFSEDMRHSAVHIREGKLFVFYSMVGDNPERILLSVIDLEPDWMLWSASDPLTLLEPEMEWEGANLPLEPSYRGTIMGQVRQLRDPAVFSEGNHTYLLYSIAGESGIAIAELVWP